MYLRHFTIGQVSRILGISTDTLRYYDKINLLSPEYRGENGYRYYSTIQLEVLITIKSLRAMDVPINQIEKLISGVELKDLRILIKKKEQEIIQEQENLKWFSKKLSYFSNMLQTFEEKRDEIAFSICGPYWIYLTTPIQQDDKPNFEKKIQKEVLEFIDYKWVAFSHTIAVVGKEDYTKGIFHKYKHDGILSFMPINKEVKDISLLEKRFCARKWALIERQDYTDIDEHYISLLEEIEKKNYVPIGDSLEINIFNQHTKHYLEIQIPVKKKEK